MPDDSTSLPSVESSRRVLIYACSGASNVAEIADRVARKLAAEGKGQMFCLASLGADNPDMIQTARDAELNLVIDGCPMNCAQKIFARHRLTNIRIIRVTDYGIPKAKGVPATGGQIDTIHTHAAGTLESE